VYKFSNNKQFKRLLSVSFLSLTAAVSIGSLNGCAGHAPAVQDNRDPSQVMNELNTRIQSDQDQQISTLSPQDFQKAKESYDDANKSLMKSEPDNQDVLTKARESEDWLTKAEKNASVAKISLASAIEARQNAINAGANTYFKEDFNDADSRFTNLTKNIEDGNLGSAKDQQEDVANNYASLEKRAVYRRYAFNAKQSLTAAKDQGAKKWAPDQLKDADAKYQTLSQAIEANPQDTQNIENLSVTATQSADQLLKTTQDSKYLASLTPEERAKKLQEQQSQISSLQGSAAEASTYKEKSNQLEQQTAMTDKIKAIQQKFSPDEAEVYQQGNNAIIRLKGIAFPKAGASIPPKNYELMGKVASTVKEFGPQTKVVVAGSTDSTGGQKINQKLSEERADAVKNFLVAQDAVPEKQIETEGLGSSKPIATNKTAEGRKANRRVDVTIEPQQAAS
jgi:OmpA-OmpF porin, OOP family